MNGLSMKIGCHVAVGGRDYLEDSITVIRNLNEFLPAGDDGIKRSFFAVFDGHGGALLSDYLSKQFHIELCKRKEFLTDPKLAFELCWRDMDTKCLAELSKAKGAQFGNGLPDGSTATVCLIVNRSAYIANCGDSSAYAFVVPTSAITASSSTGTASNSSVNSQAVPAHTTSTTTYSAQLSSSTLKSLAGQGSSILLTDMHSTDDAGEIQRVLAAGGEFRGPPKRKSSIFDLFRCFSPKMTPLKQRVYPGGLLVTRAYGDFHAKRPQQGGKPGVIIPDCGEIRVLSLPDFVSTTASTDSEVSAAQPLFIVLASDGVWDGVPQEDVMSAVAGVVLSGQPVPEIITKPFAGSRSPSSVAPVPDSSASSPVAKFNARHKNTIGKLNGVLDPVLDDLAASCVSRAVNSEYWIRNCNSADNASCIIISFV